MTLCLEAPGNDQVEMDAKSVHRGFTATTTINRKDFGLTWKGKLKNGDAVVGDEVKIELDVEAVAKPVAMRLKLSGGRRGVRHCHLWGHGRRMRQPAACAAPGEKG